MILAVNNNNNNNNNDNDNDNNNSDLLTVFLHGSFTSVILTKELTT